LAKKAQQVGLVVQRWVALMQRWAEKAWRWVEEIASFVLEPVVVAGKIVVEPVVVVGVVADEEDQLVAYFVSVPAASIV
jgi:hypothetical protein